MKTLLVAGAGQGLGKSVAKRFAREGYAVALAARNKERLSSLAQEIGASPFPTDLTNEGDVASLFRNVEVKLGAIEAVAFVAATRVQGPFAELSAADFENVWRQSCLSGFLVGREAARAMLPRARGSVIFTGASGSTRGRADFAAFAAAKGGLRFMAQSMARELGPKGIHVATVLIDGAIASERMWRDYRDRMEKLGADGALQPDAIAETYWQIHSQPRSAWTHEVDLRPWKESF
ncbi:MAG TPA: SDR family NAD(P)-dependent oxidoreductase [Burkholderiales bacterium]|jgi:NAD(P)-dependent dehydrogenase (short-subunit alcohol dehydrogenase family)|nr:SDR family NAD(P)-dependent oxidoreductase [Burkholderiales bacterium]